jgi:hypothetical protein
MAPRRAGGTAGLALRSGNLHTVETSLAEGYSEPHVSMPEVKTGLKEFSRNLEAFPSEINA